MPHNSRCQCFVVAVLTLTLSGCKEEVERPSFWSPGTVTIDGTHDEWTDQLVEVEPLGLALGLRNDTRYLYVSLVGERSVAYQAMAAGLTVWLDPNGGTDEGYGVRHPVPPDFADLGTIRGSVAGRSGPSGTGASSSFDERLRQAELIGPGERGVRRVPLPIGGGFDVAAQFNGPTLVYELRVPLARDRDARMGLGVAPGTRIGVGFATGNLRDLIDGGMRFPGRPGSFGGGIGGLGGTGRGGPGRTIGGGRGGGPERSDPLELWARVDLASPQ